MFKQIFDLVTQVVTLTRDTQRNTEDIKALRSDVTRLDNRVSELTLAVQRLAFEVQRTRESEAQERRILLLQIEKRLDGLERGLPPGDSKPSE